MRGRFVIGVLLAGFLLGGTVTACSSDSPEEAQPSATLPRPDATRDVAIAKAMALRAEDMPPDFAESTKYPDFDQVSEPGDTETEDETPKACENVDLAPSPSVTAVGKLFVKNEQTPAIATVISSDIAIYEKAQDVQDDFRAVTNKSNQLCTLRLLEPLADSLHNVLTGNALTSSVNLTYLPELSSANSFGLRVTALTAVGRQSANLYVDFIGYFSDRAEVSAIVASLSGEPPLEMERDLLAKLRKRVAEAATTD